MILDSTIAWKILAGAATQVRRVVDNREPGYRERQGRRGQSRQRVAPFKPHEGTIVTIQKPARKDGCDTVETVGRATITAYRTQRHGDISFVDVRVSGFKTTAAYKASWVRLHDRAWLGRQDDQSDAALVARFDSHHADTLVYVLEVEPVKEARGRFLAADPGAMETDYVESSARAMPGELEAVEPEVQQRFSEEAYRRDQALRERKARELSRLPLDERVRLLANRKDIDLSREMRLLSRKVNEAAERHGLAS